MKSKYNPLKEVRKNIGLVTTEAVGYGIAGKIAGDVDTSLGTTTASTVFGTGASLAGMPSLVHSGGSVLKAVDSLYKKKK